MVRLYLLLILFRIHGFLLVFSLRGMERGAGEITGLLFHWILSDKKFNEDNDAPVTFRTSEGGALEWGFNSSTGAGTLTQGTTTYAMHGQQGNDLNAGKNLIFLGQNGQIDLKDNVAQGAGSLTFHNDYTVATSNNSTDRCRYYCG